LSDSLSVIFLTAYRPSRYPHSFPTRRSSDLGPSQAERRSAPERAAVRAAHRPCGGGTRDALLPRAGRREYGARRPIRQPPQFERSEEHTSEIQSRVDLVCRLLLEKKNKQDTI